MNLILSPSPLQLRLYGFSGLASNNDETAKAMALSHRVWEYLRNKGIKNKGKNIWVYDADHFVFAGVELEADTPVVDTLEEYAVCLDKYVRYKHIGPYAMIQKKGKEMRQELINRGYSILFPYLEIYGHPTIDENQLETDLIMAIR